ncbi:restriction endonuclease subunit S [Acinetobacter cumulans]|uniref:restriction endonuclease subunit S n=1 Tax=Acinetobacter cumulans TaxID=2136182 RepID=UPI000EA2B43C|nr:restriction endonuclease subunit S [Acinetobacter cumulans]RKG45976.1 restriction endonuclease subunit S [Acinetobacter cumulans]
MAVPKLRFKEFDGDWFQSKIGEIFQVTSGSTPLRSDNRFFENADIAWVKTTDLNNGLIEKTEEKISQIALKETSVKILPKGTVFVAMYGGFNQIGRTGLLVHEAACNQALSAIYPNEKIDSYFLLTFLNHKVDDWKNFAASSRKDPNITKSDVLAFPLKYPVKEEQTKIAFFLSAVDEKISQLTQKHELLSQYKQGMMQKLFSQEIRFKADDGSEFGEWEETTLGEIGTFKSGQGFPEQFQGGKDGIPFFKVSDMNILGNEKIMKVANNYVNSEAITKMKAKVIDNEAIIFAKVGAAIFLERKRLAKNFLIDNNMMAYLSNQKMNIMFLKQFLDNIKLSKFVQVGALPSYNSSDLAIIPISLPCLEEQTKIANFLSAIDQKLEVVAQQIEQAKTWKKGLLQQMFV